MASGRQSHPQERAGDIELDHFEPSPLACADRVTGSLVDPLPEVNNVREGLPPLVDGKLAFFELHLDAHVPSVAEKARRHDLASLFVFVLSASGEHVAATKDGRLRKLTAALVARLVLSHEFFVAHFEHILSEVDIGIAVVLEDVENAFFPSHPSENDVFDGRQVRVCEHIAFRRLDRGTDAS